MTTRIDPAHPAVAETHAWIEHAVIGLNLCPFAKAPHVKGQLRLALSDAADADALLSDLVAELRLLAAAPADGLETTLLIHPGVMADFADYNDFLDVADAAVAELGLEGVIQVASFHPHYQFADSEPADLANATNRSPHPTLHLLREDSISRAVAAFPEAEAIYEANIATMERLGAAGWAALQRRCREDASG
jgi:hypothetical protein